MRSLVIDDEYVALAKMVAMLEPFGPCDAVTNAQQALALFTRSLSTGCFYHLVTIDINMPDMTGIALLGRLQREEQARCAIRSRKVIITAASTPSNVLAAATGDCDGFLAKPVRRAVLLERLAALKLLPQGVMLNAAGRAGDDTASAP